MAFTVTRQSNKFRISVGDHRPVDTESVEGITLALQHYFTKPFHKDIIEGCPFCQAYILHPTSK